GPAPADDRVPDRVLGRAHDDRRAPSVRRGGHRLHRCGHRVRGARPDRRARRYLPHVPGRGALRGPWPVDSQGPPRSTGRRTRAYGPKGRASNMTSINLTDPAGPGTAGSAPRVGMFLPAVTTGLSPDTAATARLLAAIGDAGLDHVCVGDHVSFAGFGFDGLTQAAVLAALHPTLPVHTGVYLLPLRHPVLVARQIADLGRVAPGRLVFGVGIGGEDRHEVAICGVDPATRGRRMNEALTALRRLLTGEPTSCYGEFYGFEDAVIAPAPAPPVPII